MPTPRASFVGRSDELELLRGALGGHRLVTVSGLGGTGKTRLAMELVARGDGLVGAAAAVAELAPAASLDSVVAAVAAAVAASPPPRGADPLTHLVAELRPRELLLLLDNCEHVLAESAELADRLLDGCPALTLLATSREPLRLAGEFVLPLAPLEVDSCRPGALPPAVQLFVDRASAVKPGYEPVDTDLEGVSTICRLVDGIPLAIELAAARVAHLTVAEIADRLRERQPLPSRAVATPDRHRSLSATLEWSYELLSPIERRTFRRLGVFAGPATLEAVEAVCDLDVDALELVSGLVDKNLVSVSEQDGRSRYGMFGTVRRYAQELLDRAGESAATRRRHAEWFAGQGPTSSAAAVPGDGDHHGHLDDVLAALRWANGRREVQLAYPLAIAAARGCEVTGRFAEGRELLADALELSPGDDHRRLHGRVLVAAAQLSFAAGSYESAHRQFEAAIGALRAHGGGTDLARALNSMATSLLFEGDAVRARRLAEEALERFTDAADDAAGRAYARTTLGIIEARTGSRPEAERHLLEALRIFRGLGHRRQAASVLNDLGHLAADAGDPGRAHRFYEGALQLQREVGDDRGAALSLNNLSIVARQRGNLDRAWEHAQAARDLFVAIGDGPGGAAATNNLANLAVERDQAHEALSLYGESINAFRGMGDGRRMATAMTNLAELAEELDQRQLAWDCHVNATSVWNQLGLHDRVVEGIAVLERLARRWEVHAFPHAGDAGSSESEPEPDDPETISHLLEAARWIPVPPAPRSRRSQGKSVLTPRETQVVGEVARGLSNAEIAAQLFISERTVESHIANVRQKLLLDSRTKLTRWAIEHGIVT